MLRKISFILALMVMCMCTLHAQSQIYSTQHVKVAAEAIGFSETDVPSSSSVIPFRGIQLVVRKNTHGEVEHIGRKIFPESIREAHPSPVYDYLEYAYLNHTFPFVENPFIYKDLSFLKGSWMSLKEVTDQTPFGISVENQTHYRVTWNLMKGDVEVVFPIDYDKLSMEPRKETENNLIHELKRFTYHVPPVLPKIEKNLLIKRKTDAVLIAPGDKYLKSEINQDRYLEQVGDCFTWIWTRRYPVESLANLLLTDAAFDTQATIQVTFLKYENVKETILLSLRAFLAYFREGGCEVYWGAEELNENEVIGTLFIYNAAYGYDHVVKITCPLKGLGKLGGSLTAKASLFVPTNRVTGLFFDYKPGKSTKKEFE